MLLTRQGVMVTLRGAINSAVVPPVVGLDGAD